MDIAAKAVIIQKEKTGSFGNGILTFIEKMLTMRVGSIIAMVIRVRALIRILRLLLTIEARASIMLARTWE